MAASPACGVPARCHASAGVTHVTPCHDLLVCDQVWSVVRGLPRARVLKGGWLHVTWFSLLAWVVVQNNGSIHRCVVAFLSSAVVVHSQLF